MIIYNFRANGPYEYDKFMLNFGQLYNMCADTQEAWRQSNILQQDRMLTEYIERLVDPDDKRNTTNKDEEIRGLLARLAIAKEILTE